VPQVVVVPEHPVQTVHNIMVVVVEVDQHIQLQARQHIMLEVAAVHPIIELLHLFLRVLVVPVVVVPEDLIMLLA
jgi:hypothetical protein